MKSNGLTIILTLIINSIMNNFNTFALFIIAIIFQYYSSQAQCHVDDWTALKALYESADGNNWTIQTGWDVHIANQDSLPVNCNLVILYGVTLNAKQRVEKIILKGNILKGPIPSELEKLTALKNLNLKNNCLSGQIPKEISKLSELETLILTKNELSENIPVELSDLTNLTNLQLNHNKFSGSIPAELSQLNNIKILFLSYNNLTGIIPIELGSLDKLTKLKIRETNISGVIPAELGNLSNLNSLNLDGNDLEGSIPAEFEKLSKLDTLKVQNNQLSGCFDLKLKILCTQLSMAVIDEGNSFLPKCHIDDWTALKNLYINTQGHDWDNQTGWDQYIKNQDSPPSKCNLADLFGIILDNDGRVSHLSLSGNNLTDSLPAKLGDLSNLVYLNLIDNNLTGSIPKELGKLKQLEIIHLKDNQLSGKIPASLGDLCKLTKLRLDNNQLSGSIPASLGNLSNLITFILKENNLSGCYDKNLKNLCSVGNVQVNLGNELHPWDDFCIGSCAGFCASGENEVNVLTNYLGCITIELDNNQNQLKNDYAIVYDPETCADYEHLKDCEPVTGFKNLAANEALYIITKAAEYFRDTFNKEVPQVNIFVNDISSPNDAIYNLPNNVIVLGNGDEDNRKSMSAPDIVGHEYAHAVLLTGLGSFNIPGALNESYADIFGELIERYCYSRDMNWVYGDSVTVNKPGIRSLSNPKDENMEYQLPDTYEKENWVHIDSDQCSNDDCGIHTNSGVHSYWFYLLANGGSGINDKGNAFHIKGIGIDTAVNIIFKSLNDHLDSESDYIDAMFGSVKVAIEEYGENSFVVNEVIKAWLAVGIDYYEDINPIKFEVTDNRKNGPDYETDEGNIISTYVFDLTIIDSLNLTIDSLSNNISLVDPVSFTLHLPSSYFDLRLETIYSQLITVEIDTSIQNTMKIRIYPSNSNPAKTTRIKYVKSKRNILGFGVCIVVENFGGDCIASEPIVISGVTQTSEYNIPFKPSSLVTGNTCCISTIAFP